MEWARTQADSGSVAEQGSKKWLEWRGKGLGSSDAAVLLGLSPWKNITQLYEEKLGLWKPVFGAAQRAAMDRGTRLEPEVRKWYEALVNSKFPDDTAEHPEHKFMRASFDGRNHALDKVLEIKCPNAKDHEMAKNSMVPEKYLPQCNWLMMVGGHSHCAYVSYGTDDTYAVVEFSADREMQAELMRRAKNFWHCVQERNLHTEWFPKYEARRQLNLDLPVDHPQVAEQDLEGLVAITLQAQAELNAADARFTGLKERLKAALGSEEKMEKGEAVFGWQTRKGAVDYSAIPELAGMNLEKYRKPDNKAFYFKRKGSNG
jgi:putative phage-type endonuclease